MTLGHNNPPSQAAFAEETAATIGDWLKNHPVIQTEEEAKEYKVLRDRGKSCIADMQDERYGRVKPLRDQVNAIDEEYREPKALLEKILGEGDGRVNVWIKQEEERRRKIKEEAWKKVQQAEEEACAATERERVSRAEAALGVETDILATSRDAERSYKALQRAEREAARAERAEGVRVTGGHRRALSTREHIKFTITDPILVVQTTGWSDRLYEALETEVREYYRNRGVYPKGVLVTVTEKVQ